MIDDGFINDETVARVPIGTPDPAILKLLRTQYSALEHHYDPLFCRAVATIGRACLILADHSISAIDASDEEECGDRVEIHANTIRRADTKRVFNQGLEWHLREVSAAAEKLSLIHI